MEKIKTLLLSLTALIAFASSANAKNVIKPTYLFGFAASFNDSTVYFTDVQEVDSAWISSKNKFLFGRDNYSYQLKNYLASIGQSDRTCLVEYSTTKKGIEKKYEKLMGKYLPKKKKGSPVEFEIKHLTVSDFRFKAIQPTVEEMEEKPDEKPKQRSKRTMQQGGPQGGEHAHRMHRGQGGPISPDNGQNPEEMPAGPEE